MHYIRRSKNAEAQKGARPVLKKDTCFGRSVPEPAFKSFLKKNVVVDGKRGFCHEELCGRLLVLFGGYFAWVNQIDEEVRHG
jgi:hypothetical protein